VSAPRQLLEMQLKAFGERPFVRFMLNHGRDYPVGPETYAGPRGTPQSCYMNATHLAINTQLDDNALTYVEGSISVCGIPIDHAWCINADGIVIDPTLKPDKEVRDYFGVPFQTDYVRKAILRNKVYGLLDIMTARKTLPKLIELGLEDGQRWLIGGKRKRA
jgi:hypothetical protein